MIPDGSRVLDVGCGVGYGSKILADAGHIVDGLDISQEAVSYGRKFYAHPLVRLHCLDAVDAEFPAGNYDVAVCFEMLEHVEDPAPILRKIRGSAQRLISSVPNEDVIPFGAGFAFHHRHYTRDQFLGLLSATGWDVCGWYGQEDHEADVDSEVNGRTLITIATVKHGESVEHNAEEQSVVASAERGAVTITNAGPSGVSAFNHLDDPPKHVAILGLGPSVDQYLDVTKRLGGKHAFCDETWGINALGGVLFCDRVFHMDDVKVQEARAAALPESNIARMVEWMKFHPGPIITSRAYPDYPGLVEFPLQDVLQKFETPYFNSTAAYALAYALHIGVERISIFGCDYTYPNQHDAEKGRACLEFWIGMAMARGVRVAIAQSSSLMDALGTQAERLYGYDTVDVTIRTENGRAVVDFVEKDPPTAEEIEQRYDHSVHPNALVTRT